jgi:dihydrofolate synthase / folylpolyglutamate synthase
MKQTKLYTSESFQDSFASNGPDPGIRLELQNIKTLLEAIGNPQDTIPYVIHVAGTNGKGSTIAFLGALLNQLGIKIGVYTSPHLNSVTERFKINQKQIEVQRLNDILKLLMEQQEFNALTYFEKLTAAAFKYFAEEKVDVLLLETGLGGRLDATNIINKPTLCLITNVTLDHQEYLGNTIEEIAYEKAGILKPQVPFMTSATEPALTVIRNEAIKIGAPEKLLNNLLMSGKKLGLKGPHQCDNANLAANAFYFLCEQIPFISQKAKEIEAQLLDPIYQTQNWPGRFQEINLNRQKIILDGAHNIAGAMALRLTLHEIFPNEKRVWLLGFLKNKDHSEILKTILQPNDKIIFTHPTEAKLSADLDDLRLKANALGCNEIILCKEARQAFKELQQLLTDQNTIGIVSGSLYLIGKILDFSDGDV